MAQGKDFKGRQFTAEVILWAVRASIHLCSRPSGTLATTGRYLHARLTDSSARYLGV